VFALAIILVLDNLFAVICPNRVMKTDDRNELTLVVDVSHETLHISIGIKAEFDVNLL
jgi:hypothetical protein